MRPGRRQRWTHQIVSEIKFEIQIHIVVPSASVNVRKVDCSRQCFLMARGRSAPSGLQLRRSYWVCRLRGSASRSDLIGNWILEHEERDLLRDMLLMRLAIAAVVIYVRSFRLGVCLKRRWPWRHVSIEMMCFRWWIEKNLIAKCECAAMMRHNVCLC